MIILAGAIWFAFIGMAIFYVDFAGQTANQLRERHPTVWTNLEYRSWWYSGMLAGRPMRLLGLILFGMDSIRSDPELYRLMRTARLLLISCILLGLLGLVVTGLLPDLNSIDLP